MNCYYSNLIEGHNTTPREIERAIGGQLDQAEDRRNLQIEARAHLRLQREIDRLYAADKLPEPASLDFILWLHRAFYEDATEPMLRIISGQVSNVHLQSWTKGRVREIDDQFLADQDAKDLSRWLYNGPGTPEKPGDLGYWAGYRIAKAYYLKAADKRVALKTLLELKDPKAILADSGWRPGDPD